MSHYTLKRATFSSWTHGLGSGTSRPETWPRWLSHTLPVITRTTASRGSGGPQPLPGSGADPDRIPLFEHLGINDPCKRGSPEEDDGQSWAAGGGGPSPLLSLRTGWAPASPSPPGGERAWSEFSASALVRTPEMTRCLEGSHSGPKPRLPLPAGRSLWSRSLAPRKACRGHPTSPWPGSSDTEQSLATGAQGLSPSSLPVPASADHIAPQPQP